MLRREIGLVSLEKQEPLSELRPQVLGEGTLIDAARILSSIVRRGQDPDVAARAGRGAAATEVAERRARSRPEVTGGVRASLLRHGAAGDVRANPRAELRQTFERPHRHPEHAARPQITTRFVLDERGQGPVTRHPAERTLTRLTDART